MWRAMAEPRIPTLLINLIKFCVEVLRSTVRIGEKISNFFAVNSGLRQGDV